MTEVPGCRGREGEGGVVEGERERERGRGREGEGEGERERELSTDSFTPLEGLVDNGHALYMKCYTNMYGKTYHRPHVQRVQQTTCTACTTEHMYSVYNRPHVQRVQQTTCTVCTTDHMYSVYNRPHVQRVQQTTCTACTTHVQRVQQNTCRVCRIGFQKFTKFFSVFSGLESVCFTVTQPKSLLTLHTQEAINNVYR